MRGDSPIAARIDALIEAFDRIPGRCTLFIGNVDCCTDAGAARLFDRLVFGSGATLRLVLSSTRELPLDIACARLEDVIRLLGASELAFDEAEIRAVFGPGLCGQLGDAAAAELLLHTGGWPAAVRMMQIILDGAADPRAALGSFSGSDETLAHLLNRQVLSAFPAAARQFLLRICLLRTFCLDLCRELLSACADAGV